MANQIDKFISEAFGKVRGVYIDGQAWLYATDVCKCLEMGRVEKALARLNNDEWHFRENTPAVSLRKGNGGSSKRLFLVNEAGLYRLIFTSRSAKAEEFQRWVTHEVLPKLRRDGEYRLIKGEAREGSKVIRKSLNDTVKKFCEYLQARDELDRPERTWHIIFSNLVNNKLGIKDNRDNLTALQLFKISDAEELIARIIERGMEAGKGHHDVFNACEQKLTARDDIANIFHD